jgi:hypothetical protein
MQKNGGWAVGRAPFGNQFDASGSNTFSYRTYWPEKSFLYVRKKIFLNAKDLTSLNWYLGVDNGYKLYVNGTLVSSKYEEGYTNNWEYQGAIPRQFLKLGENIISLELQDGGGLTAFDMVLTAINLSRPVKYLWSNNQTSALITVNPSLTTNYSVLIDDGITQCRDTATIVVKDYAVEESDITVCIDKFPFNWRGKNITAAGVYYDTLTNQSGCRKVYKANVRSRDFNFNPFQTELQKYQTGMTLDAGSCYLKYRWSSGDTTQSISPKNVGNFVVTVTNEFGCTSSDSIQLSNIDTVFLSLPKVNAICNNYVDVPVRIVRFSNLLTLQGSVNWNTADLRFDSIASYGVAALKMDAANFGINQSSSGKLTFSWNNESGTGLTLPDSSILFTMRFMVLGNTIRKVPITITGTPTPLESYNADLDNRVVITTPGEVNVTCEFTITGKVLTPMNHGVRNVVVTLTGGSSPLTTTTDSNGNYSFKILPGTYTLSPVKTYEKNKTNGISTLDVALIQAHILQRTPFNAAYKVIAGDANNSSGVTTGDILFLRRLILGTDTTLPNNRIWAFVDGDQTFANPLAPFPFSATKTLTNQSTDITHTFRGIKIGDVNYDRNPLLDQAPSGDTLRLFGVWTDTEDGYATLRIKSRAVNGLMGWQSTLRWDQKQLQLQSVQGRITNLGIGERWKDEGYLTLSWNDPMAEGLDLSEGVEWMELRFRKTSQLNRVGLNITEEKLVTEAFNKHYQSMGVKMERAELRGISLGGQLRVYPNPASSLMNVEWRMEKAGAATIRLFDAQGRVVHVQRGEFGSGIQRVLIRKVAGWSVSGTWMVQVESDGQVKQLPVVVIGVEHRP